MYILYNKLYNLKKEKILAILRLQKSKAIGDILAKKLIVAVGDIEQLFNEKPASLQKINGIGSFAIQHLFDKQNIKLAEQELDFIEKNNYEVVYFLEDDFPKNLLQCIDSPFVMFKDGNINLKNDKILSIVGTRNMSTYGKDFCEQLIEELAVYNPIIVSGFAYGVDICAHKAAIKNNLQTIGVLAHGFEQMYPKVHKKYVRQVMENGGFFTEFGFEENPLRENFLKRNRIVAGISEATIIIESADKGGSLVTADIANSYDRDVFALPGRTNDIYSKGCNNLIKNNKAILLTSSSDIVKMLNWDVVTKPKKLIQQELFITLSDQEQMIYNHLKENGKQMLDLIAIDCNIPLFQLSSVLLQMELKGIIKSLPGKMFELQ
ncbi:MAG: DNA-protecting protein DprA [Flavobacteriia bacterium]|nr:DNA-protecting protein DprA [Flavobacteriia bacterium]NCT61251.1 DNA-protecting protein DprA [Flavobacteriia bacterium]OIP46312.1 MAG: DNA protecting protein DprA [Flavobacteriaceae bacterium CG2_30_31_66]